MGNVFGEAERAWGDERNPRSTRGDRAANPLPIRDSASCEPLGRSPAGTFGLICPHSNPPRRLSTQPLFHKGGCPSRSGAAQPGGLHQRQAVMPRGVATDWSPVVEARSGMRKGKCHDRPDLRVPAVGVRPHRDQHQDPSTADHRGRPARLSLRQDPQARSRRSRRHVRSVSAVDDAVVRLLGTPDATASRLTRHPASSTEPNRTSAAVAQAPDHSSASLLMFVAIRARAVLFACW